MRTCLLIHPGDFLRPFFQAPFSLFFFSSPRLLAGRCERKRERKKEKGEEEKEEYTPDRKKGGKREKKVSHPSSPSSVFFSLVSALPSHPPLFPAPKWQFPVGSLLLLFRSFLRTSSSFSDLESSLILRRCYRRLLPFLFLFFCLRQHHCPKKGRRRREKEKEMAGDSLRILMGLSFPFRPFSCLSKEKRKENRRTSKVVLGSTYDLSFSERFSSIHIF